MSKILLIEDDELISEMYRIKFEHEGFETILADNGKDGVVLAKSEHPDLILLDLVMPKMDGYQVLNILKSDDATKNIKVYVLSNLVQNGEIDKGFESGADGYLIKANITPGQLVENIKKIFSGESVGEKKELHIKNKKINLKNNEETDKEKKKILIIEDEESIIDMYKTKLEAEGYYVESATNGAWGLRMAKEKKYDIILLDMVMPAMNGHNALKQIKANGESKDTPIIVLSNSAQDRDIDDAITCGASFYLIKSSITPKKLVDAIKGVLK